MNAKEAKQKANEINKQPHLKEIKKIENLIEDSVKKGLYMCRYNNPMVGLVKENFEELGFRIESYYDDVNYTYFIHWR